jgi:sulfopyruvate decarboxylase alpha subunit
MTWAEQVYEGFKANGIRLICYVPDTPLGLVIKLVEADPEFTVVPLSREEEGGGILAGGYLGGVRGALLMQSTGLGNTINAITTLSIPHQLPFLMLISLRGDVGDFNAVNVPVGRVLPQLLDVLTIQHVALDNAEKVRTMVDRACKSAFRSNYPLALILTRDATGGKDE